MSTTFTVPAPPPELRRVPAIWAYFVRPTVVTEAILGRPVASQEIYNTFVDFREDLIEESGLDRDRFIGNDIGTRLGFCIVLRGNIASIPPVSPEVAEKLKEFLLVKLGEDRFVGPKWFKWCPT